MKDIKCVIWDLDNTLWNGILLEDEAVHLKEGIYEILSTLDERGILLSIASKNNFEHGMEILKQMKIEHFFLYPQINWNSKSSSILEIQQRLNIGMDTILFVDDQEFERDEVKYSYPEVEVLDSLNYKEILQMPRANPLIVTEDSKRRRLMYLQDQERQKSEEAFIGPKSEFLKQLNMKLKISRAKENDLLRLEELTRRTNQLNSTGIQYSYQELETLSKRSDYDLWVCELEDKYGDYGKIGMSLVEKKDKEWVIKLLLMSCRTVSKGVGTVLLLFIIKRAMENHMRLFADFKRTDRNRQMLLTYQLANFQKVDQKDSITLYENDFSQVQDYPAYINIEIEE